MSREARGSSAYTTLDVATLCDLVQHAIQALCPACPSRLACAIYEAFQEEKKDEA